MSSRSNSNQNKNPSSKPNEPEFHGMEPWMLTAFVLGELSPEESGLVEQALAQDAKLQEERTKIERSIQRVSEVFRSMDSKSATEVGLLTSVQRDAIISSIHPDGKVAGGRAGEDAMGTASSLPFIRPSFIRRPLVLAALAVAASVPILILSSKRIVDFLGTDATDSGPIALVVPDQTAEVHASPPVEETNEAPVVHVDSVQIAAKPDQDSEHAVAAPESAAPGAAVPAAAGDPFDQSPVAVVAQGETAEPSRRFAVGSGGDNIANARLSMGGAVMRGGGSLNGSASGVERRGMMGASASVEGFSLVPPGGPGGSDVLFRSETPRSLLPPELHQNLKSLPPSALPPSASVPVPSGDRFDAIVENQFEDAESKPVTTFSIDVDTASYSFVRQMLQQRGSLPSPDMVRIEELVNYFTYAYEPPTGDNPFAANLSIAPCPWAKGHRLVRVGVQAKKVQVENRPRCNLVFLIDVSGSMADANKLPLVQRALSMLVDRIEEGDRVAIAVYAGAAGLVLESTSGHQKDKIRDAVYNLQAGGSTNGGEGIRLAYKIAKENFISGGANRVVLCTDGDFNVGLTNPEALIDLVKEEAKSNVYLTCLGFGQGNYNDSLMERISKDGNGFYGMVDSDREAKKLMVDQLMGTLVTVAKDVKLQMDFNPNLVKSYRLIGYENRQLSNADFNNDLKDAGDIGAGHSVTALYEIIPTAMVAGDLPTAETESKYTKVKSVETSPEKSAEVVPPEMLKEWLTLRIRYKQPEASESTKQEFVLENKGVQESAGDGLSDKDFGWAASVAEFGLLLRKSKFAPNADWERLINTAASVSGSDEHRVECVELMRTAKRLSQPR